MKRSQFVTLTILFLLVPLSLLAQGFQVGIIGGEVKDPSGAVLPGVTVEVTNEEKGFSRSVVTDSTGRFLVPTLPIGRYRVTASLAGFQTKAVSGNLVESDRTTSVDVTLSLSAESAEITVTGEAPVVDPTNTSATTRISKDEFEKLPVGRSYQSLMAFAPGVVGGGNPNAHGSLTSTNVYLFDGVDTTDPTTGTFGSNLNFEALQEVQVITSGASAEYGRATGAILNAVTKSGSNDFEGSAKLIATNDNWDEQNKTRNQVTGASNARMKRDHMNERYSATLGGPIWRDRAWFFGAYETAKTSSAARQTAVVAENFVQSTDTLLTNYRVTGQITPRHTIWAKYAQDPITGFVIDYFGTNTELEALTGQDQGGDNASIQYAGIFGDNVSVEAMYAEATSRIDVYPYQVSSLNGGAPHFSLADSKYYNGGAFVGYVDRPREQATVSASYFANFFGSQHNLKAGADWQKLHSNNFFTFPNDQLFIDTSFDPVTRASVPSQRRDYQSGPSQSEGDIYALYLRDKFEIGTRLFMEVGLRYEQEEGQSDIGETTIDTQTVAPRLNASFDIAGNGKSLIIGSAGRFYEYVVQSFSDNFANVPQRAIYDLFTFQNGQFVFTRRQQPTGNSFRPNTDLDPTYLDEVSLGFQQQFGATVGVGVRGIWREWGDLIEDVEDFQPGQTTTFRQTINDDQAYRQYRGLELTFEKRFSHNWNALANYTFSETEGNHFSRAFSSLRDYTSAQCRTTIDLSIGNNGIIPCSEVVSSARLSGNPGYDRPHHFKVLGGYSRPLGPVNLAIGLGGEYISGLKFSKTRAVNVLLPGTTTNAGPTLTYFYEGIGQDQLDAIHSIDTSLEVTIPLFKLVELGVKGEAFNVTDQQEQTSVNNTVFCGQTSGASSACTTARTNFGKATARGSFQAPRSYRLTALLRF